jgi:dienelactone hydrolase
VRIAICLAAVSLSVALAGCGGHAKGARVTLTATPASALADTPVAVTARGLAPHAAVTLRASWAGFGGARADSTVPLRADGDGRLDLRGLDGARFLWGMRIAATAGLFGLPATDDTVVHLSLAGDGKVVARANLHRHLGTSALRPRPLTFGRDRLVGWFFAPPGVRRRPAVLAIGGSEGGVGTIDLAALLASHGHPTLALGYFAAPGLPERLERIPLEYFQRGLRWLARQPSVDPRHMTMMGISRGAEATLLSGVDFPKLVHAAIALVPEPEVGLAVDGRTPAWTYRGTPLPQEPIAVERIRGAILMVSAEADAQGPSSFATEHFEQRLAQHRFAFFHQRLDYPGAGHDVGAAIPYLPQPDRARFGGTQRATALAKTELWPRILHFLDDHAQ